MTRVGWGALVVGAVFVIVGWRLTWAAFVVLGAGCLILVAVALAYLLRRPHLRIQRDIQPPRVSKGSLAIAYLDITNKSRLPMPPMPTAQQFGPTRVRMTLPRMRRGERLTRTCRLPTDRRGIFDVGPVEISRADPFAFVEVTQRHTEQQQIWVYPAVLPFHPLPTGLSRPLEGPTSDTAPQGNITFHQLREYVVGDDLRMIHWPSTARTGELMVRHNIDTTQPFTVVLVDLNPHLYSEKTFETALDAAASVAMASSLGASPVQLRLTDGTRAGGPNQRDLQPLFDTLTAVQPVAGGSVRAELTELRRERGGSALCVITGAIDEGLLAAVGALRHQFQRVVVISITPEPVTLATVPGVVVLNATDGEDLTAAWNVAAAR